MPTVAVYASPDVIQRLCQSIQAKSSSPNARPLICRECSRECRLTMSIHSRQGTRMLFTMALPDRFMTMCTSLPRLPPPSTSIYCTVLPVTVRTSINSASFSFPFASATDMASFRAVLLAALVVRCLPGALPPAPRYAVCFNVDMDVCTLCCEHLSKERPK